MVKLHQVTISEWWCYVTLCNVTMPMWSNIEMQWGARGNIHLFRDNPSLAWNKWMFKKLMGNRDAVPQAHNTRKLKQMTISNVCVFLHHYDWSLAANVLLECWPTIYIIQNGNAEFDWYRNGTFAVGIEQESQLVESNSSTSGRRIGSSSRETRN